MNAISKKIESIEHKFHHYVLLTILLLAAIFRFYHLDGTSLWSDEGNTWALLSRTYSEIATAAAADIHPPGYYWLLKIWTTFWGDHAFGMRSFSALCGTLLTFVVYQISTYAQKDKIIPLLSAFIIALNPFQIYYSQESRMYMLLALESALLLWSLLAFCSQQKTNRRWLWPSFGYVMCAIAGLWTHYSFPIVFAVASVSYGWHWLNQPNRRWHNLAYFALLNLVALVNYLPWIPTAIDSILHWPQGGESLNIESGLKLIIQQFTFGPLQYDTTWMTAGVIIVAILLIMGLSGLWKRSSLFAIIITSWLLAPILLMFGLGLFSDSFLKFLLVASPPCAIVIASASQLLPLWRGVRASLQIIIAIGAILLTTQLGSAYYTNSTARDNYAGMARYIEIMGNPEHDIVLLNAPGQQEVWEYYDPGLPVLALPTQRPPNRDMTLEQLVQMTADRRHIYSLFWATDESDPENIVEGWLDQNAFKGLESWQGNLRFVTYTLANEDDEQPCHSFKGEINQNSPLFKENEQVIAALEQSCLPNALKPLISGQVALISLNWRSKALTQRNYKVTLQLLNDRNQVIAQRDSEPAGGSQPTSTWQSEARIVDNHGLTIPLATPPGIYRLILAFYDAENGERLIVETQEGSVKDFLVLGDLEIGRSSQSLPTAIMPIQHRLNRQLGPVVLVGYTVHTKGLDHAPLTPLRPNDLVQFTFYWQAPPLLSETWPDDLHFTLVLGGENLTVPLVGSAYPTQLWQADEVVRGTFDLRFDGTESVPTLSIAGQEMKLYRLPRQ